MDGDIYIYYKLEDIPGQGANLYVTYIFHALIVDFVISDHENQHVFTIQGSDLQRAKAPFCLPYGAAS